jgi:hypothetical protein
MGPGLWEQEEEGWNQCFKAVNTVLVPQDTLAFSLHWHPDFVINQNFVTLGKFPNLSEPVSSSVQWRLFS